VERVRYLTGTQWNVGAVEARDAQRMLQARYHAGAQPQGPSDLFAELWTAAQASGRNRF